MNRPDFDILTPAEIKKFRQFVNLSLQQAMKRCMPAEMREMKDNDLKEKEK